MSGLFAGHLVVLKNNENMNLNVTKLTYHNQSNSYEVALEYGLLRADRVNASLVHLDVEGLTIQESSLISIACPETSSVFGSIKISNSTFSLLNMSADSSILSISEPSLSEQETCAISISIIQNNFSNISSLDLGPLFQMSASKLIGMGNQPNVMTVNRNNFQNITSNKGAIYSGKHLTNNATVSFELNNFSNIHVREQGRIFYIEGGGMNVSDSDSYPRTEIIRNIWS